MSAFSLIILASASLSPVGASSPTPSMMPLAGPAPAASRAPDALTPLREIGHVRATTTFCQAIIEHATRAVQLGVDNDGKIDSVVRILRATDFDSNSLSRSRGLQALNDGYAPLIEQAVAAERAASALHADAKGAPTADEAKAVTSFADAFDGALHRQRTIARDVASMIAIFNSRPPMTKMEHDEMMLDAQLADTRRGSITYDNPQNNVPPLLSTVAKDAADQLVYRQEGIRHDEMSAAQLVVPMFGGC